MTEWERLKFMLSDNDPNDPHKAEIAKVVALGFVLCFGVTLLILVTISNNRF